MKSKKFLLILVGLLIFSLACGFGGAATEKVEEAKATAQTAAQEAGKAVEQAATTVVEQADQAQEQVAQEATAVVEEAGKAVEQVQETTQGEEETALEVQSLNDELANFSAYRSKMVMNFDGTNSDGTPSKGSITMFTENVKEPQAMHMSMQMEGDTVQEMGGSASFDMYDVDGMFYMQNPQDGSWMSFPSEGEDTFNQGFFSASDVVDIPKNARCDLLPSDVNGISTKHCKFSEKDINDATTTFEKAAGEVWIARDGGYPVKLMIDATINNTADITSSVFIQTGSFKIEYELMDINGNVTITLPEGAKAEASAGPDLPMVDDAKVQFSSQGMSSYTTAKTIKEIGDFYRKELVAQGWTADANMDMENDTSLLLQFNKEGTGLMISADKAEDGTITVSLMTNAGQ